MSAAFAQAQVSCTPQGYPQASMQSHYPQAAPAPNYPTSVYSGKPEPLAPAPVPVQVPAPVSVSEPSSYTDQAIKARLSSWESKYSTYSAGDDDGIKY